MFRKPRFAIVAKDEAVHWLICTVDLYLNEAGLVAAAFLTLEEAFELFALSLDFLVLPVRPLLPHSSQCRLVSFILQLFRGKVTRIKLQELLR